MMYTIDLKAIFIPDKLDEGDEWKERSENFKANGQYLPLIICTTTEKTTIEVEESNLESKLLSSLQIEIGDKFVTITPDIFYKFDLRKDKDFIALLKTQKCLCIEIRVVCENRLRFSIGSVWDDESKSWIFEPHSKPVNFWS